jgi:DNA-binding NarL/FixJ family response regulator
MEAANEVETPIRVLIADDHRLFVEALEAILATDERLEVVGRARTGQQAVDQALELAPDVILMDISMPVMDGVEATRLLRDKKPDSCVIMLTGSNSPSDIDRSREAGVAAYVTKDRIASQLLDTIFEVATR